MRIEGMGIDLIEIDRVERALERWGFNLEERILTSSEMRVRKNLTQRAVFLAGRFAAKEAIFKSLGINPYWHKVLVLTGKKGEPTVSVSPDILEKVGKNVTKVLVSISHCRKYALAQSIAIG